MILSQWCYCHSYQLLIIPLMHIGSVGAFALVLTFNTCWRKWSSRQWLRAGCPQVGRWSCFIAGVTSGSNWLLSKNSSLQLFAGKMKNIRKALSYERDSYSYQDYYYHEAPAEDAFFHPHWCTELCLGQWFLLLACDLALGWLMAA